MKNIFNCIFNITCEKLPTNSSRSDNPQNIIRFIGQTRFNLESFRTDRFGRIDAFSPEWMQRCADARSKKG